MNHIIGSFVIHADAAFFNGAGIQSGSENKNTVVPKLLWQKINGKPVKLPYISSQSFRRCLRNTANEDNNWSPSTLQSIDTSSKGSTSKIATFLNPVDYPEDDIFGYMRAGKGGTESVQRTSPFRNSIVKAIPGASINKDEAFVHLEEGTPLPYSTEFYVAHMQGIFGLDIGRLGRYINIGSRVELESTKVEQFIKEDKLIELEGDSKRKSYELKERDTICNERIKGVLHGLIRLRGGAKMAAFGADMTPKIIVLCQIEGGNLIFNDLFEYGKVNPCLKLEAFEDIINAFNDRIQNKVYVGFRKDYLENHGDIPEKIGSIDIIKGNTMEVVNQFLTDFSYA